MRKRLGIHSAPVMSEPTANAESSGWDFSLTRALEEAIREFGWQRPRTVRCLHNSAAKSRHKGSIILIVVWAMGPKLRVARLDFQLLVGPSSRNRLRLARTRLSVRRDAGGYCKAVANYFPVAHCREPSDDPN